VTACGALQPPTQNTINSELTKRESAEYSKKQKHERGDVIKTEKQPTNKI
jgi:hypothetical protein